ncbi:MAG: co-chaperone GroES family protein [Nitrospiraceae bacterium]|nr:co-chaperone GroES family protein [Nitrospiraceae bacterium]
MKAIKNLIMTGDRVLIEPDEDSEKSAAGLYLPPNVKEKERARGGKVIRTGPGYPIPESGAFDEPWTQKRRPPRYFPIEASEGDYAIYLKSEAVDIEFENKKYVIVPYSSILALVRTEFQE